MAAQAKTRRSRAKTAAVETKAHGDLEIKEAGTQVEEKAEPKAKPALDRLENIMNEIKSLEATNAEVAGELHGQERSKGKGNADPLTEQKQDSVVQALERATEMLREMKAERDALEVKSQRPPQDGAESMDFDDHGTETKSEDFDLELKSAWEDYWRYGDKSGFAEIEHGFMERKDMTTLSDPDGGFFVPIDMDSEINEILLESGGFREHARVRSTSLPKYKKPTRAGGVDAAWVGEKDARPRTGTPQYEMIEIETGELYARPAITQTLLEDAAFDPESEIAKEVADAFLLLENDAFVNGSGSDGRPKGLLTYPTQAAAASWGKFQHTVSGATDGIDGTDPGDEMDKLIDMQHTLKTGYRSRAAWYVNDKTLAYLRKLRDGDGRPFLTTDLTSALPTMLGSPVRTIHELPDMANGKLSIGYGDLSRTYTILDRIGTSMERFYDSNTAPFVEFYTRKRVGGGVEFFEAFKFMKFAA